MKKLLIPLLILPALAPLHALTLAQKRSESFFSSWIRVHDQSVKASQFARAIAMDSNGNVFVAGHMDVNSSKQLYVAKYDALDGRRLWQRTITATGTNQVLANAIAVDKFGDCVVVGSRNIAGSIDFYTHKFVGATGADAWLNGPRTLDGTANGQDVALKVVTDGSGNVIVTGRSAGSGSGDDIVTVKYARGTGNPVGMIDRYSATAGAFNDFPGALAVDGADRIIVGGVAAINGSTQRFVVRKLATDLSAEWTITPIDLGGEGGVTGLAVGNNNHVVATGLARNANGQFGYYTTKLNSSDGSTIWKTSVPNPVSADTFGSPRPGPVGVAIGPDDQPIVSGTLLKADGTPFIQTVKYTSAGVLGSAFVVWESSPDAGLGFGDTIATAVTVDADSNAVVVGASENEQNNRDIYIAKYDGRHGTRIYAESFDGAAGGNDSAIGAVVDRLGNISVLTDVADSKGGSPGVTYRMIATIKLHRFIAVTGDNLPAGDGGAAEATFSTGNAPAVADNGSIAAKVTLFAGKKKQSAIITQGAGGRTTSVALQGQPAPGTTNGSTVGNWISFSDPVIAPEGSYAFAAKVSGSAAKANGLWTNASGELRLVLQQGTPVPGLTPSANLSSILSYSMTNTSVFVLLKAAGPAATSNVLLRIADNGTGTILLRSGQEGLMIGGKPHTVKSMTVLSPAPLSPGDGRWDGLDAVVARVVAAEEGNSGVTREALLRININGAAMAFSHTGKAAPEIAADATYRSFGLPAVANNGFNIGFIGNLNPVQGSITAANDTALLFNPAGLQSFLVAREGDTVPDLAGVKFSAFSDPVSSLAGSGVHLLWQATFKTGGEVNSGNNRALMLAEIGGGITTVARTGANAAQPLTDDLKPTENVTRYGAFTAFALPGGPQTSPIFLAKLSGPPRSSNLALFARGSDGENRRLIRTGDDLDGQKVKTITLLKPVSKASAAARSFSGASSVVVRLTFTNGKNALLHIDIP